MMGLSNAVVLGGLTLLLVVGVLSGWLARAAEGSAYQTACQRLFAVCLALVGLANLVSIGLPPGYWITCGTSLCVMVLTATCHTGGTRQAPSP